MKCGRAGRANRAFGAFWREGVVVAGWSWSPVWPNCQNSSSRVWEPL